MSNLYSSTVEKVKQVGEKIAQIASTAQFNFKISGNVTAGAQVSLQKEKTAGFTINFLNATLGKAEGSLKMSSEGVQTKFDFDRAGKSNQLSGKQELSLSGGGTGGGFEHEFTLKEDHKDLVGFKATQSDLKLSGGTANSGGEVKYDAVNNSVSTGVKGESAFNFAIGFGFQGKIEASLTYDLNKK